MSSTGEVRVHKNRGYTIIPNDILRDLNLTLKAKALLGLMLSLPDDWDYTVAGLTKLVKEGYLERREVAGDRRKTELVCTSQADSIIEKGRLVQKDFKDTLFNNMDDSMKEILFKGMEIMEDNLDRILEDQ